MGPIPSEDPRDPHWQRETALTVRDLVLEHERILRGEDGLVWWRAEVRGMVTLVRFGIGTSVLSAIVSILALVQLMQKP